ncbi:MAG: 30S ribosomal protein S2 [Methanocalculus sp. MSAO_Arc1]|uniref:30S ribosomal protein S2 n=1 Tax=Methanocalculus TaxID=71151 RepID=UPI000FF369EB|nr:MULTISPECIES: 30S ribosomal protein S2 [unclassified Methanocalculus]MCP1662248.1 small subunit ribosomal protein S2 [Methanocalculus sp. AMF5]RQD81702.1 MAG: 30S ribosomal protein S2 [Methanocalculus sp. MSAO_Arc1]
MSENELDIELNEPLVPVEEYLAAGVHIGTQQKSNEMKNFIYRVRGDGLYIIDIRKTDERIKQAAKFLSRYEAPKILTVTSRQYGQYPARRFADTIGAMAATGRFIPGMLTNPSLSKTALNRYIEPDVVIVTDPIGDAQVVREAVQTGIPVIALCDTNNSLRNIDLVIPTNNKGRKALSMVYYLLTKEMLRLRGVVTSLTPEDFETDI